MSLEFSLPIVMYGIETFLSVPASTAMMIRTLFFFLLLAADRLDEL